MDGRGLTIAIDGPAGAGKSTVARRVAGALGYFYIDSGAMYRAATLRCLLEGVDMEDEHSVAAVLHEADIRLHPTAAESTPRVCLDGLDVTERIRSSEVGQAVSSVARHARVRSLLSGRLREHADGGGIVMDGRDIGTVVLPAADLKLFLTASPTVRASRRHRELLALGERIGYDTVLAGIIDRDKKDSTRETAPLKRAEDAIVIDTSEMTIDQVVKDVLALCERRGAKSCFT